MSIEDIATRLETIANELSNVRLPVREAVAYSTALTAANRLFDIAKEMKEGAANEADNKPE